MQLLHRKDKVKYLTHAAGKIVESIGYTKKDPWIIDTGSTNHMVVHLSALIKTSITNIDISKRVYFQNSDISLVTYVV